MTQAGEIQLVAVQMTLELKAYWDRDAFAAKIDGLMREVARAVDPGLPTLVAFPEDVGLMLVLAGMEPRLQGAASVAQGIERAVRALFWPALYHRARRRFHWVPALFFSRRREIASIYFDVFAEAARRHRVYLVAGSVVLPPFPIRDGEAFWQGKPLAPRLYNTSYFFGPDGKIIGKQDKVNLIDLERDEALRLDPAPLGELRTYETELGKVGIAVCLDAFEDPVVDTLVQEGAEILVQPSANPGPWDHDQQVDWLRGSYRRVAVEERFEYAVNPMMNGSIWEIEFYGQSAIVAKVSRTVGPACHGYAALGPAAGFLAVAKGDATEEVLVARVPHPRASVVNR